MSTSAPGPGSREGFVNITNGLNDSFANVGAAVVVLSVADTVLIGNSFGNFLIGLFFSQLDPNKPSLHSSTAEN